MLYTHAMKWALKISRGLIFKKILRQYYDNLRMFVKYADLKTNLRHYNNRTNTLNIVNIIK